jgi:uncharacterized membrane protein SpoIIM required for sporulation
MRQRVFEERHEREWERFEAWLKRQERRRGKDAADADAEAIPDAEIPRAYRRVCQQLALARDRFYGADVVERLNHLAVRGHRALYGTGGGHSHRFLAFVMGGFPRQVRREGGYVAAAALLFLGPFLGLIAALQFFPDFAYYILDARQLSMMEAMYKPDNPRIGRTPEADSAFYMFGVYVWNNIKIAFQTFAGGLLFGVGTLFFLLFNGFVLGTVAGHLTHIGYVETFYSFVSGHSALELTGIVISGAAGLKLGVALIAPGRVSRKQALVDGARHAAGLMYGAAGMLLVAAFVEAFWSPLTEVPANVKYLVGVALWLAVGGYLALLGRGRGA